MIPNSIGFELPKIIINKIIKQKVRPFALTKIYIYDIYDQSYFTLQILHEVAGKLFTQFRRQLNFVFNWQLSFWTLRRRYTRLFFNTTWGHVRGECLPDPEFFPWVEVFSLSFKFFPWVLSFTLLTLLSIFPKSNFFCKKCLKLVEVGNIC